MADEAAYPSLVGTYTTKADKVDLYEAGHINRLQNEMNAVQTELGTLIKGSAADLKARLGVLMSTDGAFGKGASFPTNPVAGQPFFKTDEDLFYIRSAANDSWIAQTQILTPVVFSFALSGIAGTGANGIAHGTSHIPSYTTIEKMAWAATGITGGGYRDVIKSKYKHLSGVQSIQCYARIWASADNAIAKIDIGGSVLGSGVSSNGTAPQSVAFSLDVSGLTNGSYYDMAVSLKQTGDNTAQCAFMDSLIGFAL